MPYTPSPPYPKTGGHMIRSADWNSLIGEVQRLDTDKLNNTGGALRGPLTINAALAVGTATGAARLHVVDSASPAVLRVQSTLSFGAARIELWSDPQGSGTEWRPGYVESFDAGSFTGGLAFYTNGSGAGQRTGSKEALRLVNGRVGLGVSQPGFIMDVGDRIRLRQGPSGTAGIWLFQTAPNIDPAFVGMVNDTTVGMWGSSAGWGLQMSTTTGNLGVRTNPSATHALAVGGDVLVSGRVRDNKLRVEARAANTVSISAIVNATAWATVPNLSLVLSPMLNGWFLIQFDMAGTQAQISNASPPNSSAHAEFRLLIDGAVHDFTLHEFHNNGWELRSVSLSTMIFLSAATHTVEVQWSVKSPNASQGAPPLVPERRVTLTGCWYGDTRRLTAIEL